MSVQVALSVTNDRYMLGSKEELVEFETNNEETIRKLAREEDAHDRWFQNAKSATWDVGSVILSDARRHLEEARKLKSPVLDKTSSLDSRWSSWSEVFYRQIAKFFTCQEVLHYAQSQIPFDHREYITNKKSEFITYEKLVQDEFPFQLENQLKLRENPRSIPETLYLTQDRLASNIFYWHMRIMFQCMENVSPLERILEVGGGYGSLARLWLTNEEAKIKRYVIVDLPESLFYSEVCLKAEFGDQIGYWEGSDPGTKVVLVPVGRIDEYKARSDLVINVGSLQEMNDTWVNFYMEWLDRYQPSFFYSLNYMGNPIVHMWESRNFWAPRPSPNWATRILNADIPLVKMMCSGRSFVEVLYERAKPKCKFSDWSVLKGAFFNRATYLEGLELFRQDPQFKNALDLLSIISIHNDNEKFMVPKETLYIASALQQHPSYKDNAEINSMVNKLVEVTKLGTH